MFMAPGPIGARPTGGSGNRDQEASPFPTPRSQLLVGNSIGNPIRRFSLNVFFFFFVLFGPRAQICAQIGPAWGSDRAHRSQKDLWDTL